MTKNEFMSALCAKLSVLPEEDIHNSLSYYSEMIEDCRENGMSEEEVHTSVFATADVNVYGEHFVCVFRRKRLFVVMRFGIA